MRKNDVNGIFVISLDFELFWGVQDIVDAEEYKENILGVRSAIPKILNLFKEYEVSATWATVGFLFFENRQAISKSFPAVQPGYLKQELNSYKHFELAGNNELDDPLHYGLSLVQMIKAQVNQEIGSHTFSHYYCLEEGQNIDSFRADMESFLVTAKANGVDCKSIVFPRNQVNDQYLAICADFGLTVYRGNPGKWAYQISESSAVTRFKRLIRLIDTYLNLMGHNTYRLNHVDKKLPVNVPASRFFRPFSKRFGKLEPIRLRRIISDLDYAAKNKEIYHLWWHPHNFGIHVEKNLENLEIILKHFASLRKNCGMESLTMGQVGERVLSP